MNTLDNDLVIRNTVYDLVRAYETETARIKEAYACLETAQTNLNAAFSIGESYRQLSALPRQCYRVESVLEEVMLELKESAWRNIINRLGIKKILSLSRANELDNKLSDKKNLPEITAPAIFDLFESLSQNIENFAREAVQEVYKHLHYSPSYTKLKTNHRNAREDLGPKVILHWHVRNGYGNTPYQVNYSYDNALTALDKVFHILDGKPFNQVGYKSPLVDAINTSPTGHGETDYFKFHCYQNQNLHVEFKRADLLKEFNRIANDGTALKSGIKL